MAYKVQSGDTLSQIALNNNTDVKSLSAFNNISNPDKIYTGQSINIPVQASTTLPVSNITTPETPVIVPASTAGVTSSTYTPAVDNAITSSQDYLKQFQLPTNSYETNQNNVLNQIQNSMGILETKNATQQHLETSADITGKKQLVQDFTNQILANKNDIQGKQLNIGKFGDTTQGSANAEEARYQREGAVKNLNLSAQLAAAQGNLSLAQDNIDRAVTLKYEDEETRLKNLKDYLSLNEKQLERQDAKALNEQKLKLQYYETNLANKKADTDSIQKIAITAGGFGANAGIINKITSAKTVSEAIAAATGYLSDPIAKQKLTEEYKKLANENRTTYGGTGDISSLKDAFAAQESNNNYKAYNPDSGAMGKYQIMPSTLKGLGFNVTKEQYLNSPELQEQAYTALFDELNTRYNGDQQKIAADYYGGPAAAAIVGTPAGDKKQGGGKYPSINDYVKQVLSKITPVNNNQDTIALQNVLSSSKFTAQQRKDLLSTYNAQGMQGLKTFAYNNLSVGEKENFNNFENGSAILASISQSTPDIKTGAIKDVWENVKSLVGAQDKTYADFKSKIEVSQAPIRKGLYGTALTGTEANTAKSFLIDFQKDTPAVMQQKAQNLSNTLRYINDANIAKSLGTTKPDYNTYITGVGANDTQVVGGVTYKQGADGLYYAI
jgi:murein DD-endopeptidase MepM/ murein hydrolase activator NlpD